MKNLILLLLFFLPGIAKTQSVYKTPAGSKYHLATCRMVKNTSTQLTIEDALQAGLDPCKICKPPVTTQPKLYSSSSKASGVAKSVQCAGITKAGNRCKHITKIANGFCFQHQPK